MQKYHTQGSRRLYQATLPYLVDGVGSSFHVPSYRDYPIAMTHGKGSKLYDVDGNEYIDYILGFGPMLLGHCPPAVDRAVAEQLKRGTHFSAPTPELGALSRRLTQVIPAAEKVVYQNSGTEVVMYALRLARAFTGRYKIVKFEGQYHGWSDEEKVSIDADTVADLGPRENPRKILPTKGQRLSSADDLILLPWNDLEALDRTLTQRREEIAAVLMEPCMCDSGPILPQPGYLAGVRELTRRHGVLLIFDEVITGFRLGFTGASGKYQVAPDLITYGKIIGAGMPVGAYGGRKEIMQMVSPCGPVYQAGTLSGNPVAMAAGLTQLKYLYENPKLYEDLTAKGHRLYGGMKELVHRYQMPYTVNYVDSLGCMFCTPEEVTNYSLAKTSDTKAFAEYFAWMLNHGFHLASSQFEAMFLSEAHTDAMIDDTLTAVEDYLKEQRKK